MDQPDLSYSTPIHLLLFNHDKGESEKSRKREEEKEEKEEAKMERKEEK